jgi:enoyl-CoA hydratase/carnithine racemase
MSYETIEIKKEGAIDWLTLNRPERLNVMNPLMCDELQDYFGGLQFNHAVRIVILRGAGRAFCGGYDLKDAAGVSAGPVPGMRFQRQVSEIYLRMHRAPQPMPGPRSNNRRRIRICISLRRHDSDAECKDECRDG